MAIFGSIQLTVPFLSRLLYNFLKDNARKKCIFSHFFKEWILANLFKSKIRGGLGTGIKGVERCE